MNIDLATHDFPSVDQRDKNFLRLQTLHLFRAFQLCTNNIENDQTQYDIQDNERSTIQEPKLEKDLSSRAMRSSFGDGTPQKLVDRLREEVLYAKGKHRNIETQSQIGKALSQYALD